MGRKYYCDHCDRRLPPGLSHRKSHNQTIQHRRNRQLYYVQFQDPVDILLNERSKNVCMKWSQSNSCPFGINCKYSHLSNYELIKLIEQATQNLNNKMNFNVDLWIQKRLSSEFLLPQSLAL